MAQILVFRLGSEMYGLEVAHIQEVVESPPLYYIPRAPDSLIGAMNFHGSILPVLDLAACLGFGEGQQDPRIVVLTPAIAQLALAVSAIQGTLPFADEDLLPTRDDQAQAACIRAVLPDQDDMINLLDLDQLLGSLENFLNSDGRKSWG